MTMNLTTTAGALHAALKAVRPAIRRYNSIPILSHVRISRDTMTATDLDIEIKAKIPASTAKGAVCLDHRVLSAIVGNLPRDTAISITTPEVGKGATLAFEGGLYTLSTLPASDFPDADAGKTVTTIKAPDDFLDKLRFVSHFISTEETRYYLNGVCIAGGNLVATDGHRLGYVAAGFDVEAKPIIPRAAVAAILSIGKPAQISFSDKAVTVDFPGIMLRSKLIDGAYPDYRRVIPAIADGSPVMVVDAKRLVAAIKRVSATGYGHDKRYIDFAMSSDGRLAITCQTAFNGTARETIPAEISGVGAAPFIFSTNGAYMRDMVTAHRGSARLALRFIDEGAPIRVTSERDGFNAVQMPSRTSDSSIARNALTLLAPSPRLEAAE